MSCELISVDFKSRMVRSRVALGDVDEPEYNPFQDAHFKMFTGEMAELAKLSHNCGANPRKIFVAILDEENEFEASMADDEYLPLAEQISGIKRVLAKLEAAGGGQRDPA